MIIGKRSRIILALDVEDSSKIFNIMEQVHDLIDGVKIGYLPILKNSVRIVKDIKEKYNVTTIVDLKIADIPFISKNICKILKENMADYAIVHAFLGENVLKECSQVLDIFSVVAMTHNNNLINKYFKKLAEISSKYVCGFVLPANKPSIIREIRDKYPDKIIISPGVGIQGAKPGDALKAGADYEIIGRIIYSSNNPRDKLKKILGERFI